MRLTLAKQIVERAYAQSPNVHAVFLAGSVSRGLSDKHSDIEINVLWQTPPTDDERLAMIAAADGTLVHLHPYEDSEWSEVYTVEGIKIELSGFLFSTLEQFVHDVTVDGDSDMDKQVLVAALQTGVPLAGTASIERLQSQLTYPDALVEAMLRDYLHFDDAWYYAPLAARGDVVMWHEICQRVIQRLLYVLAALNRQYVSHPRLKWVGHMTDAMTVKPEQLLERITTIYRADFTESCHELQRLAEDVRALAAHPVK